MNLIYYDLYQSTRLEKFVTGALNRNLNLKIHILAYECQALIDGDIEFILVVPLSDCNTAYGEFLKTNGEQPVTWKRATSMEEVLREADVVRYLYIFIIFS